MFKSEFLACGSYCLAAAFKKPEKGQTVGFFLILFLEKKEGHFDISKENSINWRHCMRDLFFVVYPIVEWLWWVINFGIFPWWFYLMLDHHDAQNVSLNAMDPWGRKHFLPPDWRHVHCHLLLFYCCVQGLFWSRQRLIFHVKARIFCQETLEFVVDAQLWMQVPILHH